MEPRPNKLLEQVSDAIRLKHYSPRTEESYVYHSAHHPAPALFLSLGPFAVRSPLD